MGIYGKIFIQYSSALGMTTCFLGMKWERMNQRMNTVYSSADSTASWRVVLWISMDICSTTDHDMGSFLNLRGDSGPQNWDKGILADFGP